MSPTLYPFGAPSVFHLAEDRYSIEGTVSTVGYPTICIGFLLNLVLRKSLVSRAEAAIVDPQAARDGILRKVINRITTLHSWAFRFTHLRKDNSLFLVFLTR